MPVLLGRCQGGLRGLRRWAGSVAPGRCESAAHQRADPCPTGDAPCQAGPPPRPSSRARPRSSSGRRWCVTAHSVSGLRASEEGSGFQARSAPDVRAADLQAMPTNENRADSRNGRIRRRRRIPVRGSRRGQIVRCHIAVLHWMWILRQGQGRCTQARAQLGCAGPLPFRRCCREGPLSPALSLQAPVRTASRLRA